MKKGKQKAPKRTHIRAQIRARKVMEIINENPSIGMGSAMLQAGYAPITATNPHNLTKTQTWLELLEEYLPHNEILQAHRGLLKASHVENVTFDSPSETFTDAYITDMFAARSCTVIRTVRRKEGNKNIVVVYFWSADQRARKDGLEMAYKLRGSFAPEKHTVGHFSLLDLGKVRSLDSAEPVALPPGDGPLLGEIEADTSID